GGAATSRHGPAAGTTAKGKLMDSCVVLGSERGTVNRLQSVAFVFFGATGDLAYKKIFPALQEMIKRGTLAVPIIGVTKGGSNLPQLQARARDSLEQHSGVDPVAFPRLISLLKYVDGDYSDPANYRALQAAHVAPPEGP